MAYWRNPVLQTAIRTKVPLETTSQLKSSLPQPSTGWKLCQLQGNDFMLQYDIHLQYSDTHIDESARLIACVYIFPFGLPKHLYFPDHWKSAHFSSSSNVWASSQCREHVCCTSTYSHLFCTKPAESKLKWNRIEGKLYKKIVYVVA